MSKRSPDLDFRGDLQIEVMKVVWRLGEATVDAVREQQPKRARSAYTTVQTVLNRLVERGVLTRERTGRAFVYKAKSRRRPGSSTEASSRGASTGRRRSSALRSYLPGRRPLL